MPEPLRFHFDFSSPYGYLASEKIEALAARHGRGVDVVPLVEVGAGEVLDLGHRDVVGLERGGLVEQPCARVATSRVHRLADNCFLLARLRGVSRSPHRR